MNKKYGMKLILVALLTLSVLLSACQSQAAAPSTGGEAAAEDRSQDEYIYVSSMGNLEFFNAHKYGWSVEYIQNLELPEIAGLLSAIYTRHDMEDLISQANVNRGMAGKIDSVRRKKVTKADKKKEVKNLYELARLLGKKVQKVEK